MYQEPQVTPETQKEAGRIGKEEVPEEEAAAPESNLNIHKEEESEGNTEKPAEESHGLHRWFGFFSPRKPERESVIEQEGEQDEGLGGEGDEIIAGDSWQRGAGDGVIDGSNVHSPTERGLLRDDQPTEIDQKTFFNVERRHKGHQGEEKMVVATSQATRQKYQPVSINEKDTAADPPPLPAVTIEAFDDEADQISSTLPSLTSNSFATTNKTPATTEVKITTTTPVTTISETRTPPTSSAVNASSISTTVTPPPASSTSRATTTKASTTAKATTATASTAKATTTKATTAATASTATASTAKATTTKAT